MKPKLSEENIKANLSKRHKSSTDIEKFIPKKTSSNKKSYLEIKDKENKENNNQNNFFICNHKSNFISFCEICSLDLCSNCEEKHISHKIIKFAGLDVRVYQSGTIEKHGAIRKRGSPLLRYALFQAAEKARQGERIY